MGYVSFREDTLSLQNIEDMVPINQIDRFVHFWVLGPVQKVSHDQKTRGPLLSMENPGWFS